jgi:hypothetical protein
VKKREAISLTLHITVGAALAALVCWNHWFMVLATFIYAWLREQAQHRWVFVDGAWGEWRKRTFFDFGWMTGHRIWEVFQWVIGAAVVCLVWEIWG